MHYSEANSGRINGPKEEPREMLVRARVRVRVRGSGTA